MSTLRQFQAEAQRLVARVESEDEKIAVTFGGGGELTVSLRQGALDGVTEDELAERITRTIGDAMWELRLQYKETSRRLLGAG